MAPERSSPRLGSIDPRLIGAVGSARLASLAIRQLGRGGGTAAPGLIADRVDPDLLGKMAARLPRGAVVVAGTNGKTTVSRMLADLLEADGARVVHNRSGSNLVRGVAAAFAARASWRGDPRADVGVIEADEAAFPEIVRRVAPRIVLLNNLFRDQLDRYGELNAIASRWRPALHTLPETTTVVVNGDDPALVELTEGLMARRIVFGLDEPDPRYHLAELPHAADAAACRRCGHDLVYQTLYVSHLGDWRCPHCGLARPRLDVRGTNVHLEGVDGLQVTVRTGRAEDLKITIGVPGLYNVYNVVAAVAAAHALDVPPATTVEALGAFRAAFGRIERVTFRGRTLVLALVKNPVGFNEVLRMLTISTEGLSVPTLIAINDLAADGRDVSWLWDVDFEMLATGNGPLATTGIRGADMANRLKYAGVPMERLTPLGPALQPALETFIESVPSGEVAYILPTYTAMLDLRAALADLGALETFWRQ